MAKVSFRNLSLFLWNQSFSFYTLSQSYPPSTFLVQLQSLYFHRQQKLFQILHLLQHLLLHSQMFNFLLVYKIDVYLLHCIKFTTRYFHLQVYQRPLINHRNFQRSLNQFDLTWLHQDSKMPLPLVSQQRVLLHLHL